MPALSTRLRTSPSIRPRHTRAVLPNRNLTLKVENYSWKHERASALLEKLKDGIEREGKVLVYCNSAISAIWLKTQAEAKGVKCKVAYGQNGSDAAEVKRSFNAGEAQVLFLTKRHGIDFDTAGIRQVIHYEMPSSLEDYWHQAKMAGQDGKQAECTLMFCGSDYLTWCTKEIKEKVTAAFVRTTYDMLAKKVPTRVWLYSATIPLSKTFFVDAIVANNNTQDREDLNAAINILCDTGIIDWEKDKLKFNLKPRDLKKSQFPITDQLLLERATTKNAAREVMYRYARDTGQPLIISPDINVWEPKKLGRARSEIKLVVDAELKSSLLEVVGKTPFKIESFASYMGGFPVKIDRDVISKFSKFDSAEINRMAEQLERDGLLARVKIGNVEHWGITKKALAFIPKDERPFFSPKTYSDLLKSRHNLVTAKVYSEAIRGFVIEELDGLQPSDFKYFRQIFMRTQFRILDVSKTGAELLADFTNKKPSEISPDSADRILKDFISFTCGNF